MSAEQNAGDEPAENGGKEDDVVDITGIVERIGPMEEIVANLKSSGEATKARLASVVNSMKEALGELDVIGRKVIDSMLKEGELTTKAEEKKIKFDELLASKQEAMKQRDEAQNLLDQFLHARQLTVEAEGILAADMERLEPEKAKYVAKLERAKRKNDEYKDEISDKQLEVKEVKSKISKFKTCFDLMKRFCHRAGADETAFPDIYFLDDYNPVSTRALDTWVSAKKAKTRRILEKSSGSRLTPSRSGLSQQLNFSNELSPAFSSRSRRSRTESTSSEEEAPTGQRPRTEERSTPFRASSQVNLASSKKEVTRKPPVVKKRGRPPVAAGRKASTPKVSVSREEKKPADISDIESEEETPARLKTQQKKPVVEATDSSGGKGEKEASAKKSQPVVGSSDSSDEESEKEKVTDRLNASGKGELFGSSDTSDEDEEKEREKSAKLLEFLVADASESINKEIEDGKDQQEKPIVELRDLSDVEEEKEKERLEESPTVDKKQPVVESSDSSDEEREKEEAPVNLNASEKKSADTSEEEKGEGSAKSTSVVEKKQPVVDSSEEEEEESVKSVAEKEQPVVESSDSSEKEKPAQSKEIPGETAGVSGEEKDGNTKPGVAEKKRPTVGLSSSSEEEQEEGKDITKLTSIVEKKQPVVELSEEISAESEPLPGKAAVSTDSTVGKEKEQEAEPKTSSVAEEKQTVVEAGEEEVKAARRKQPIRKKVLPRKPQQKRKASAVSSNDSSDAEKPPAKKKPPPAQVAKKKTKSRGQEKIVARSESSESDEPADKKKRRKRPRVSSSEEVETKKFVAEEKSPDFRAKPRRSPRVKPTPSQEKKAKPNQNQKKGKMWSHASMDLSLAFGEDADFEDEQLQPQQQQQQQPSFQGNNLGITVNVGDDFGIGAVFGNDLNASSISMPNLEDILSSMNEDDNTGAVPTVAQMVEQQPAVALIPPVEQTSFNLDAHVATAAGFDSNVQEQQTWPQLAPEPAVPATPLQTQGNAPSPGFLRRSPRFSKTNGQVPSPGGGSDGARSAPKKEKPEKKSLFGLSSSDEDEEKPSPPRQPTQQLPPTTKDRNLSDSSSEDENPSTPAKPSMAPKITDQRPPTPDKMSPLSVTAAAEATKRRMSSPSPPPPASTGSSSSGGQGAPSPASSMSRSPSPGPPGGLGLAGRGLGMRGRSLSRGEPPAAAGRGRGRPLAAARHSGMGAEVKETGPGTPNWKRSFECRTRNSGGENTRLAKMLTGPGGFDVTAALEKKLHGPRPAEAGPRAFTPSPMGMAGPSRGPSPRFPPPRPPGPMRHPRPPMPRPPFQGHPPRGRPPLPPQHRPVRPTMSEDPFVRKASRSRIVAKRPQRNDQEEHAESTADEAEAHKPAAIVPRIRVVTPPPPPTKASTTPKTSPLKKVVKPAANVLQHDLSLSDSDSDGEESKTSPKEQPPPSPVSSVSSVTSSADTSKETMSDAAAEMPDGKSMDKPGLARTTPEVGLRDRTPTPTRLARVEVSGGISFQFPVLPFMEPGLAGNGPVVVTTEEKQEEDSEDDEGKLIMNVDQAISVPTGASSETNGRKRKASVDTKKVQSEKKSKFMADVFGGLSDEDDDDEEAGQLQVQEEEEIESTGNAKTPEFQLPSDKTASSQDSSDDDDEGKWVIAEASEEEAPKTPVPVATVSFSAATGAFITFPAVVPEPAAQQQQPAVQFYSKPAGSQVEPPADASGGLRLGEETSSEGRLLKIFKACAAGQYPSGTDFTMAKEAVWSNIGAPVFIETLAKSLNDIESDMMLSCQLVVKYDPSIYPKGVVNLAQGLLSFGLPTEDIHQKVVIRLLKRQKPAIERAINVGSILAFILICSHFWPFPPNLLKEFFLYALQSTAWKIGHTVMCLKIMAASGAANDKFLKVICGHLSARRLKSSVCIGCSSVKNGKCRFLWDNDKEFGDFPLSLLQAVSFKRLTHEERKLVAGILRGIKQEAQMTGKEKKGWELIECLMFREA